MINRKIRQTISILALTCALLSGCESRSLGETPADQGLNIIDDKYRTTYEIFVYSFYDSDGDGTGDLKGIMQKLDYINDGDDESDTDLGCNEIWLMPVCPSPTYHKYDVTDYMDIDPEYGTLEDFEELVSMCHERGVKVITDLVLNHTSAEHPWFTEATDYIRENEELLRTRNEIADKKEGAGNELIFMPEDYAKCRYLQFYNFSFDQEEGYEKLPGSDAYYEARFWSQMPDLNLDSDEVRAEIEKITAFWIDRGVDGFRLDAVTSYYTGNDSKNIEFMTWLNDTVKAQKEDAYIVGEAWTNAATYSKYYQSGVDSFFDFDMSGSEGDIARMARGRYDASKFAHALENTEKAIAENNQGGINAPFYTNHDMARSAGYFTGKNAAESTKLAGALNLLVSGNAFIYYGEELGMTGSGKDENKRAPMQWAGAGDEGMCTGPVDMDSFVMKYPALDEQADDEYSVYNYYKSAIKLRNTYPVIARGVTKPIDELSDSNISCFIRQEKESGEFDVESLLFIINASDEPVEVDISNSDETADYQKLVYTLNASEEKIKKEEDTVIVPAFGIAALSK